MRARIFRPVKTAMQSGKAASKRWRLEFVPESRKTIEPLMGWTGSRDMMEEVVLEFTSRDEAVAYAERCKLTYEVVDPQEPAPIARGYADNFRFDRRIPWSH